jgi:hypothetical protein
MSCVQHLRDRTISTPDFPHRSGPRQRFFLSFFPLSKSDPARRSQLLPVHISSVFFLLTMHVPTLQVPLTDPASWLKGPPVMQRGSLPRLIGGCGLGLLWPIRRKCNRV